VIYLDTSVALAHLLAEDRRPPTSLWSGPLVASRLVDYELWVRLQARGLGPSHGDLARQLLGRVAFLELIGEVVARAKEPFPVPVRTLDALHLASVSFLVDHDLPVSLATYDTRLSDAAVALDLPLHPLD
jgi:hypothetical protein